MARFRWLLNTALLFLAHAASAQNLVPNGSFEEYVVCPGGYSQRPNEFRVNGWRSLNAGSPDYFNSCSGGEAAVPYNWAGVSEAFDGHGYAGIYTWMNLPKNYREYLHCELSEPLIRDSVYRVEFRYKLSSYSKYSTDRIGLLLSDSLGSIPGDRPLGIPPSVSFLKDSALTPETGTWELARAEYKALGNEKFLTIGNFNDNTGTGHYKIMFRPVAEPMLEHCAYYYIDDVRVTPRFSAPQEKNLLPPFTGDDPELNTAYVLRNIQFEFNSFELLSQSYYDLDQVVTFLRDNPGVRVELSGHTDDLGEEDHNFTLSANRARSAAEYIIGRGIDRSRVTTRGYGEERPLVRNDTEEDRQVNRRVEIKFQR